jgi:UDP-glucose 4-epimerase
MRVLVTGACGLVGRHLFDLPSNDVELVGVARNSPSRYSGDDWISADLALPGFTSRLPRDLDAIVHLAQPSGRSRKKASALDAVDVNIRAAVELMDFARMNGVGRFVLGSTASVYRPSYGPLTETSEIGCLTTNAITKHAAELLALQYSEHFDCRIVRIFTPYGYGQEGRLIADLIARVEAGREITVEGESGLPLSPIHASDVARAVLRASMDDCVAGDNGGLYNLCGPERLTVLEISQAIALHLGVEPQLRFLPRPDPPGWSAEPKDSAISNGRPPAITLAEGLKLTVRPGSGGD